jgi:hypothetical protein
MKIENHKPTKGLALFVLLIGILTLKTGSAVLIDESSRQAAGNIVLEIVWFNVLTSSLYLLAAWGLWFGWAWLRKVSLLLFAAHLVMMVFLLAHIFRGDPYEVRTVLALSFRTFIWGGILWVSRVKANFIPYIKPFCPFKGKKHPINYK